MKMNNFIKKRVALYLRLSKEDFDKSFSVSDSIRNQELMLREEVKKHDDWEIVGIYCDEDYSGVGTYRPEFEKMLFYCENGKIDIVLCKSQSRFSRDMEIIEKYLHNKFQEWKVRFVSLVDNADTEVKENKKTRQINALINEWFLEDLSDNIKKTLRSKWKSGECTTSFAKYGLMKDPKNKNHLIIDPVASRVVLNIGRMFLKGYGPNKIAFILNKNKIPSPYEYKLMSGSKLKLPNKDNQKDITQKGDYVIKFFFYNKYGIIFNNIKFIFMFKENKIDNYNLKYGFRVRNISDSLQLYYIVSEEGKFENKFKEWKIINNQDSFESNNYIICCKVDEIDRFSEVMFELEIYVSENKRYQLFVNYFDKEVLFNYEIRKKYKWSGQYINKMLRDEIYNGTLIQGKTKRISYKNHKSIKNSESSWVRYDKALEAIFDDDMWLAIQDRLLKNNRVCVDGKRHIFSGKVYCDVCGRRLNKNSSYSISNKMKIEYLICSDKQNRWVNCDNNKSIRLMVVEDLVGKSFRELWDKYYDVSLLRKFSKDKFKDSLKVNEENLVKKRDKLVRDLAIKKDMFKKIYEDMVFEIINQEEFIFLRNNYEKEIDDISRQLEFIENEIKKLGRGNNLDKVLFKYSKFDNLNEVIVNEFIGKIRLGKVDEMGKRRNLIIVWNFFI